MFKKKDVCIGLADTNNTECLRALLHNQPQQVPNLIILRRPDTLIERLSDLLSDLEQVHLPMVDGEAGDVALIEQRVGEGSMMEIGKFCDRVNSIQRWYYQCYDTFKADRSLQKVPRPALVSLWLGQTSTPGSIAIVKNGLAHGAVLDPVNYCKYN